MSLYFRYILTIFFCMVSSLCSSQSTSIDSIKAQLNMELPDSERAKTLHAYIRAVSNSDRNEALVKSNEVFDLTKKLNDPALHGESYFLKAFAYRHLMQVDSMKNVLLESIPYHEQNDQFFRLAAAYRNLAITGEITREPDTSLYYIEKCLAVLETHPDSIVLGDVYLSQGIANYTKGFYQRSVESILNSLRIFEDLDENNRLGFARQNLAITYEKMKNFEEAFKNTSASIDHLEKTNHEFALTHSYNNLGLNQKDLGLYEDAILSHKKSIALAIKTKQAFVEQNNYYNLGRLFFNFKNDLDSCLFYMDKAEKIALELDDTFILDAAERFRAFVALKNNNLLAAARHAKNAENLLTQYVDPNEIESSYEDLSIIYEKLGNYEKSLSYNKIAQAVKDSTYTLKKDQQVEELHLIYQTEKKDTEIRLLNQEAQLHKSRQERLWGGIGLISLLAISIISNQISRRKKEKIIAEQQRGIEIQKRKNAEQELEFKKKELTAKVLQLASKNEFLQTLEEEVGSLKSSLDSSVSKTSQKISRMIHKDSLDDDEWTHFGKEFSSIHQDFMDRLTEEYGEFSNNEWRLISLLKMNLSSKDIANTLRISSDGVKKARYRLRKKFSLDSNIDIQDYLLSY